MDVLKVISITILVTIWMFTVNSFILVLISKSTIEWKITRTAIVIFLGLSVWAMFRFANRFPNVNMYDYLIILFNFGLLSVAHYTSRDIK